MKHWKRSVSLFLACCMLLALAPMVTATAEPTEVFVTEPMIAVGRGTAGMDHTVVLHSNGTVWACVQFI